MSGEGNKGGCLCRLLCTPDSPSYPVLSEQCRQLRDGDSVGMEERQVIEILGEEDSNELSWLKRNGKNFPPETTLVYYLGVDLMDDSWLILSMEEGIVTEIFIDVT